MHQINSLQYKYVVAGQGPTLESVGESTVIGALTGTAVGFAVAISCFCVLMCKDRAEGLDGEVGKCILTIFGGAGFIIGGFIGTVVGGNPNIIEQR